MVKEFERLVNGLAAKYACDGLDLDDLKQEAWVALLENKPKYNEEMGVSLQTFLGRKIRHKLEKYRTLNLDLVEVDRKWVAESIAEGPDGAIEAASKAECQALREALGASKYRKPKRVIETMRATSSLDEEWEGSDGEEMSGHEIYGNPPEQETIMAIAELTAKVSKISETAARDGRRPANDWEAICTMRGQGLTFEQIGVKLNKSTNAIKKAWARAQNRLKRTGS